MADHRQALEDGGGLLERLELMRIQVAERLRQVGLLATPAPIEELPPLRGDGHPGDPPVARVGLARNEAHVDEGGDDPGHRGRLDLLDDAQLAHRERSLAVDGGQRGQHGGGDPRLGLAAKLAGQPGHREAEPGREGRGIRRRR